MCTGPSEDFYDDYDYDFFDGEADEDDYCYDCGELWDYCRCDTFGAEDDKDMGDNQ